MKTLMTLFVLFGVFVAGCASQQLQTTSTCEIPQTGTQLMSTRDMLLLYQGNQNPGAGWEIKSTSFGTTEWERRVTANLRMSKAEGRRAYSLSLSELGELPEGGVWIGPVHGGSRIERGTTIGNMPTSSGAMIMLLLDPGKEVLRWWEP